MTTVYNDKLEPVYEIVMTWESGVPKFNWLPHNTLAQAKELSSRLAKEYERHQRFNMHRTPVPRYRRNILESTCVLLKTLGLAGEVVYNDFKDNHCHTITIRKR
jgi:hypothetical protein